MMDVAQVLAIGGLIGIPFSLLAAWYTFQKGQSVRSPIEYNERTHTMPLENPQPQIVAEAESLVVSAVSGRVRLKITVVPGQFVDLRILPNQARHLATMLNAVANQAEVMP